MLKLSEEILPIGHPRIFCFPLVRQRINVCILLVVC